MKTQKSVNSTEQPGNPLFYSIIGIPFMKKIIMVSVGKLVLRVNRREDMPSYFVGFPFRVSSLELTRKWSYFNEFIHMVVIIMTGAIGYFLFKKGYTGGVILMGFMVVLNIGLILLQHYNRIRIIGSLKAWKAETRPGRKKIW